MSAKQSMRLGMSDTQARRAGPKDCRQGIVFCLSHSQVVGTDVRGSGQGYQGPNLKSENHPRSGHPGIGMASDGRR